MKQSTEDAFEVYIAQASQVDGAGSFSSFWSVTEQKMLVMAVAIFYYCTIGPYIYTIREPGSFSRATSMEDCRSKIKRALIRFIH